MDIGQSFSLGGAACYAGKEFADEGFATIGALAREFKISLRTLRFYEDRGLLSPRRKGTARLYSSRDRLHLQMILKGRRLGFTLTEIERILAAQGSSPDQVNIELGLRADQIDTQIAHLEQRRHDLDLAIAELRQARERAL